MDVPRGHTDTMGSCERLSCTVGTKLHAVEVMEKVLKEAAARLWPTVRPPKITMTACSLCFVVLPVLYVVLHRSRASKQIYRCD